jgi:hypothetical protein
MPVIGVDATPSILAPLDVRARLEVLLLDARPVGVDRGLARQEPSMLLWVLGFMRTIQPTL